MLIARVCAHLRGHVEELVTLADLACLVGLSPAHLQRRFSAAMGCSPKAWQRACREQLLRERLRAGEDIAGAIYGAGYGSGSRVYESAGARLGMTPGQYAHGGRGVAISVAVAALPIGTVLIAASDRGICAVSIGADEPVLRRELHAEFPNAEISDMPRRSSGALRAWIAYVMDVLRGRTPTGGVPLAPRGSDFQLQVWELLRRIPSGQTRTYAELARELGRSSAARAVARACATNPIAVLIPCHRVIRGDGDLAGYRWGIERKRRLLASESRNRG
jgi:AraC family transcriptional regulator of adaptative response/methylated-DNA-[protein]-cysteine methyltransferase